MSQFSRQSIRAGKDIQKVGKDLEKFGGNLTKKVTLPLVGMATVATKEFIEIEDAFSGVQKTISGTPEQLQEIKEQLDGLATTNLPIARKDLYGIAETAGQLGVERENIIDFTETIAKVGRVTNLSYEQGSAALARFANNMQMPLENMDKLGSTIVHLDTNLATSASEIVDMGMNLASAGSQAGMTEAQVLGLAGALSSVGLESAGGGTAMSKVIQSINDSVFAGGKELTRFSKVAGMSTKEFSALFKQDASQAIVSFVQGLGRIKEEGYNVSAVLEDLGFKEYRTKDALLRATEAGDLFKDAIDKANVAWSDNIALNEVFATRTDNTRAQIDLMKNKLSLLNEQFAGVFVPYIIKGIDKVSEFADKLSKLDDEQKKNIVKFAGMAAIVGPSIIGIGKLTRSVGDIVRGFGDLGKGIKKTGSLMGAIFGTGRKTTLIITTIALATILVIKNWGKLSATFEKHGDKIKLIVTSISAVIMALMVRKSISGMLSLGSSIDTVGKAFMTLFAPAGKAQLIIMAVALLAGIVIKHWGPISEFFKKIGNATVEAFKKMREGVKESLNGIKEHWKGVKEFLKHPIKGTVDIFKKTRENAEGTAAIGKNALGTNNWRGGPTWVHEQGGEIIDLPQRTRIYPHDKSISMAREQGRKEATSNSGVLVTGNTFNVREEPDIDKIADAIARKIVKAKSNYGGAW